MKIENGYNAKKFECEDTIDIISDDGRPLYSIRLLNDGSLEVGSHTTCRYKGKLLDTSIFLSPRSHNEILIFRKEYKEND